MNPTEYDRSGRIVAQSFFDELEKIGARLTGEQRKRLHAKTFALRPGMKAMTGRSKEAIKSREEGKYPIPDLAHAKNALARAKQQLNAGNLTQAEYDAIVANVYRKYPQLRKRRAERGEEPLA